MVVVGLPSKVLEKTCVIWGGLERCIDLDSGDWEPKDIWSCEGFWEDEDEDEEATDMKFFSNVFETVEVDDEDDKVFFLLTSESEWCEEIFMEEEEVMIECLFLMKEKKFKDK